MTRQFVSILVGVALSACSPGENTPVAVSEPSPALNAEAESAQQRPNILLITMDDLGYTDPGFMGSEIHTPNLDALAQAGVALTNFHVAPSCSPTRSMLMSGTDNHLAGLGMMQEAMHLYPQLRGRPGYEGFLNNRVVALPQLLKDAGYRTYLSGKWHLGMTEETSPKARGFDKSFALLDGGSGHFNELGLMHQKPKASFRENGKITSIPEGFYSSKFYAEKLIEYLRADKNSAAPFFAFLSLTAPHWPLQAPRESIAKYKGVYDEGYEALFERRLNRQKDLKIVSDHVTGQALRDDTKSWDQLNEEEKKVAARKMEIYAAMVDDADRYLGDVIATLKEIGQFENTVIFFMSDNGAQAGEGGFPGLAQYIAACCDNSYENMGNANSYLFSGSGWARASTGKNRLYKGFTTEGGILVPAFISSPQGKVKGVFANQFVSAMDVLPTFLELAGAKHPGDRYRGAAVFPIKGRSFASLLQDHEAVIHDDDYSMGWELFGQRAIRQGDWKLLLTQPPEGSGKWALYNLKDDPTELNDLSSREPTIVDQLLTQWNKYRVDNGVIEVEGAAGF